MRIRAAWMWLAALVLLVSCRSSETIGPIYGLRLGLAPSQAREHFRPEAPGAFRAEATGEDFALIWTPRTPDAQVRSARLEFHSAQLMALRLSLAEGAPEAGGPPFEMTEISLLTRDRTPAGVELTWIARSCPVHAPEVRRRMNEHR